MYVIQLLQGTLYSSTVYSGNGIISLKLLGNYSQELTSHTAICGSPTQFIGETHT